MKHAVYVVGIGDSGKQSLGEEALQIVAEAEVLIGGERHLACFPESSAEKCPIQNNLKTITEKITGEKRRVVVLASGDPLFYGIAAYLLKQIGATRLQIIPNTSSMQLAFAAVKTAWHDALLVSCHAKPLRPHIQKIRGAQKVGIFTDQENTPAYIASQLLEAGLSDFRAFVCENLGGKEEHIIEADLSALPSQSFAALNVLILIKQERPVKFSKHRASFGIPDQAFHQRQPLKGLITKCEVRVISLSKMQIQPGDVVWDVGAGSGSVSIEAALLGAKVWAIEKNRTDIDIIQKNIMQFGAKNITTIHGLAPEVLLDLPDPDAVFIGGSAGKMQEIIQLCRTRLKDAGRLIINVATIENLAEMNAQLQGQAETTLVQISRSRPILNLTRFEALNPVFIISWEKK
ncbi:MAG: precorrin-6y C5,15-methyltransferase (decarboxylating) subunit CbiE [Nitrospirota bacterium]|nr:precorrin-6y C5,15-methyltransferase (decarboxylating) subunit CbiE [Nitrospirota bacterium]